MKINEKGITMKLLTRSETLTILALADNNFIIGNAALDLHCSASYVSECLKNIRVKYSYLFTYKQSVVKSHPKRIKGFTDKGYRFYNAAKYFIETLSEI